MLNKSLVIFVVVVWSVSGSPSASPVVVEGVGEGQFRVGLVRDPPLQVPVAPHPLPDADAVEDACQGQNDDDAPVDDDARGVAIVPVLVDVGRVRLDPGPLDVIVDDGDVAVELLQSDGDSLVDQIRHLVHLIMDHFI